MSSQPSQTAPCVHGGGHPATHEDGRGLHALVVGGSPQRSSAALLRKLAASSDLVIACDSGADACLAAGVAVGVLVGDDDSITPEALRAVAGAGAARLTYPMDKDDADLQLALEYLRDVAGAARITLTDVSGGRPDHWLGVLGCCARAADLRPVIVEDGYACHVLSPEGSPRFDLGENDLGKTLSVTALLGPAQVTEAGMRWSLDHATLPALADLGVSNVIERMPAYVECHEGVILVTLIESRIYKRQVTD